VERDLHAVTRRLAITALLAGALAGLLPAAAGAHAIVAVRGGTLYYLSIDEVSKNTLTIHREPSSYRISDPTVVAGIDPGPCTPFSETEVDCPAAGIGLIHVETGSFADSIRLVGVNVRTQLLPGPDDDVVTGGNAQDTIDGGAGADRLDGGTGDDTFVARDGAGDSIACGAGVDRVAADLFDTFVDADPTACEQIERSNPSGPGSAGDVIPPRLVVEARGGQRVARKRAVRATALSNEICVVTFTARLQISGRRTPFTLRRLARQIARPGDVAHVDLALGPKALAAVRAAHSRGRRAVVRVSAVAADNAGNRSRPIVRTVRVAP
jgi:hemolysin type calcium-binding protein